MGMPAPATLRRLGVRYRGRRVCSHPHSGQLVLHHDHIIDFALEALRAEIDFLQPATLNKSAVSTLWPKLLPRILSLQRFPPTYLCQKCNHQDAPGKSRKSLGKYERIYGKWFSMNCEELIFTGNIITKRNLELRLKVPLYRKIYNRNRMDHVFRRNNVKVIVASFVNIQRKAGVI